MIQLPSLIGGLSANEIAALKRLCEIWEKKKARNIKKSSYYDMKNRFNDLGISIPPSLKSTETVVGWPAKAVDYLSARSIFDGYVFEDEDELARRVNGVLADNGFRSMYQQATTSELKHSCSFLTISKGGGSEPGVLISAYSAENAAAEWDHRLKRIKNGMTIIEKDDEGNPTWVNLYTKDAVIEVKKADAKWNAVRYEHKQGRPLMEALVYRPSLDRPFGKSRISRAVMSITDSAIRTALRAEVSAEFFTAPQKYILGADKSVFENKDKWEAYLGSIFMITKDDDGDVPRFGQLSQMSMQPHVDYMRSLAARFSGETSIPVSALGVIHDNPSSAEAIYAAKEDLILEAESLNETNGNALRNIGMLVVAIMEDKSIKDLSDKERTISPKFKNPSMPSVVSQSDAIVKQVSAINWIGETRVALEELGYNETQIMRMLEDKRKARGSAIVAAMKEKALPEGDSSAAATIPPDGDRT